MYFLFTIVIYSCLYQLYQLSQRRSVHSLSLSLYFPLHLCISLSISVSPSLFRYLPISASPSLSPCPLCLYFPLSQSPLSVCISLSVYISLCLCIYLTASVSPFLSLYLPLCLRLPSLSVFPSLFPSLSPTAHVKASLPKRAVRKKNIINYMKKVK